MTISKSIIDQRINKIIEEYPHFFNDERTVRDLGRKTSRAFLMLGMASYLDIDLNEAYNYVTDEGNDAGIINIHLIYSKTLVFYSNFTINHCIVF